MAKTFTVSYASTLFIMFKGQAHVIPIKWDAEKENVLHSLQFMNNG